jgi:AbgT putative transporter family
MIEPSKTLDTASTKTMMQRVLDTVERVGNSVPHPVVIFLMLIAIVPVLQDERGQRAAHSRAARRAYLCQALSDLLFWIVIQNAGQGADVTRIDNPQPIANGVLRRQAKSCKRWQVGTELQTKGGSRCSSFKKASPIEIS